MAIPYYLIQSLNGTCAINKSAATSLGYLEPKDKATSITTTSSEISSESEDETSTSTFHLFTQLPSELRLKIWSYTICTARVICIKCTKESTTIGDRNVRNAKEFYSSTLPPTALAVCRESRCEALKVYTLAFTPTPTTPSTWSAPSADAEGEAELSSPENCPASTNPGLYINWSLDTLRIADNILRHLPSQEASRVQNLIIDINDLDYFTHYNMSIIRSCTSLTHLDLIVAKTSITSWSRWGRPFYDGLVADFEREEREDEDWRVPSVRIHDASKAQIVAWREGEGGWVRMGGGDEGDEEDGDLGVDRLAIG